MQAQQIQQQIEARKATIIAEAMEEFMNEEKKLVGDFSNDPIAKLRARELDLRAQENQRKKDEGEERMNLDKMKTMMNQMTQDQKLQQDEELAQLRADTSIEKTILSAKLNNKDNNMKKMSKPQKKIKK